MDSVSGDVDWVGSDVSLTNIVASLYGGGSATGWAYFDCRIRGTAVHFSANADNVDVNTLARGLTRRPSRMEGKLHVFVDTYGRANSRISWRGHGLQEIPQRSSGVHLPAEESIPARRPAHKQPKSRIYPRRESFRAPLFSPLQLGPAKS